MSQSLPKDFFSDEEVAQHEELADTIYDTFTIYAKVYGLDVTSKALWAAARRINDDWYKSRFDSQT